MTRAVSSRLRCLCSDPQGVLMKADIEGEIRVKCYMTSCSGES